MSTLKTNAIQTVDGKPLLNSTGSVIQVVSANTGFVRQTITSTTPQAITGLSATINPTSSSNKILIQAMLVCSYTYVCGIHIYRNGSDLIPNHGETLQTGGATAYWIHYQSSQETARDNQIFSMPIDYLDSPGTTSALTYQIYANSGWNGGSSSLYINDRAGQDMLSCSNIVLMEITG
jgi:hypothetical protein